MSAIFHEQQELGHLLGCPPSFSFHEIAEIAAECPWAYAVAMNDMRARRLLLGEAFYMRNAELAAVAWKRHRPWWL